MFFYLLFTAYCPFDQQAKHQKVLLVKKQATAENTHK